MSHIDAQNINLTPPLYFIHYKIFPLYNKALYYEIQSPLRFFPIKYKMASNIAIQTYALSVFFALLAVICVKNLAVERSSLCTNKYL